jgi:hypothetical protein|tara:strand:+ start:42 stop:1097 length:1056 start_codon:yes stop_codon:yes gene_type:complete
MKRFSIILLLLISTIFGQEYIITKSNERLPGKYISHDSITVIFQFLNQKTKSNIPFKNILKIEFQNGEFLTLEQANEKIILNGELLTLEEANEKILLDETPEEKLERMKKDTLLLKSGKIKTGGEIIILEEDRTIKFIGKNKLPLTDYNRLQLFRLEEVKMVKNHNGEVIWNYENYLKIQIEKACEQNKPKNAIVIPFKNDFYGISDAVKGHLDSLCYNIISSTDGLKYLYNNNIKDDDINDYHLENVGKALGANYVFYGFAYIYEVPFRYSPTNPAPTVISPFSSSLQQDNWGTAFNNIINILILNAELSSRRNAVVEAGTYVNVSYYVLDLDTAEKRYIVLNMPILKIG